MKVIQLGEQLTQDWMSQNQCMLSIRQMLKCRVVLKDVWAHFDDQVVRTTQMLKLLTEGCEGFALLVHLFLSKHLVGHGRKNDTFGFNAEDQ